MTNEELQAEVARLAEENATLKAARVHKPSLKVSARGAISVYGLGRWPVTLYRSQMERLLSSADEIRSFIEANSGQLKTK